MLKRLWNRLGRRRNEADLRRNLWEQLSFQAERDSRLLEVRRGVRDYFNQHFTSRLPKDPRRVFVGSTYQEPGRLNRDVNGLFGVPWFTKEYLSSNNSVFGLPLFRSTNVEERKDDGRPFKVGDAVYNKSLGLGTVTYVHRVCDCVDVDFERSRGTRLATPETLSKVYQNCADFYTDVASRMFDVAPERVTPDQRDDAKTLNIAHLYGYGSPSAEPNAPTEGDDTMGRFTIGDRVVYRKGPFTKHGRIAGNDYPQSYRISILLDGHFMSLLVLKSCLSRESLDPRYFQAGSCVRLVPHGQGQGKVGSVVSVHAPYLVAVRFDDDPVVYMVPTNRLDLLDLTEPSPVEEPESFRFDFRVGDRVRMRPSEWIFGDHTNKEGKVVQVDDDCVRVKFDRSSGHYYFWFSSDGGDLRHVSLLQLLKRAPATRTSSAGATNVVNFLESVDPGDYAEFQQEQAEAFDPTEQRPVTPEVDRLQKQVENVKRLMAERPDLMGGPAETEATSSPLVSVVVNGVRLSLTRDDARRLMRDLHRAIRILDRSKE